VNFIASGERMDFLVGVAQIVVCSVPIAFLGAWVSSRSADGMRGLVAPWKADPWPVGVQEEDPDAPWGYDRDGRNDARSEAAAAVSPGIEELPADGGDNARPSVARLKGSVHRPH
jgi:hypothetical protein